MVSCVDCHRSKVKCSGGQPCERCVKKEIECIPRSSHQGKRSQQDPLQRTLKRKNVDGNPCEPGEVTISNSMLTRCNNQHVGINWIVRSWIAQAFRRKSFELLEKAAALASKNQISMDQIMCGINSPLPLSTSSSPASSSSQTSRAMSYLSSLICQNESEMMNVPSVLTWKEVPDRLRSKVLSHLSVEESSIHEHWIILARYYEGHPSFLVTDAIERDVVSFNSIQTVYSTNQCEVASLHLPEDSLRKFHKLAAKQLSLIYSVHSDQPFTSISADLLVGSGHNNPYTSKGVVAVSSETVKVEMTVGIQVVGEDDAFFCTIFVPERCTSAEVSLSPDENDVDICGTDFGDDVMNFIVEDMDMW